MRRLPCVSIVFVSMVTVALLSCAGAGAKKSKIESVEWHQFRGPGRANRSAETGLLTSWPEDGPELAWKAEGVGKGYSTVSLADGLVFTMGNLDDQEQIIALDGETGEIAWTTPFGKAFHQGRGDGPRATPTIDGNRLYGLGGSGNLICLDRRTGETLWKINIVEKFNGRRIGWGISESPLIDGDKLICSPGGRDEGTMVALDKKTGETIWTASVPGNPPAAYSSPILVEVGGVRQYVNFTSKAVVGIRADDGEFLWQNESPANGTANCSAPVSFENYVFAASGYGTGGTLLRLESDGNRVTATKEYHTKDMKSHHGGMVVVDGYLYGSNGSILTCLDLVTGEVQWKDRSVGKGAVIYADGHIYLRSQSGPVALVEATPEEYREKGRFKQPDRSDKPAWPHPVVADGKLFLRDMDILLCYDIKAR